MMFDMFQKEEQFDFWWGLFKARVAPILYPRECQELDLLNSADDMGFRERCPYKFHVLVINMLLDSLQSPKKSEVLYGNEQDVFLLLLIFRQSFQLPPSEFDLLNSMLKTYRAWICKDNLLYKWPQIMESNKSTFLRIFIDHLSQVFYIVPTKPAIDTHLDMAFQVLEIFKFLSTLFKQLDTEIRSDLLLTYIAIFDVVMSWSESTDPAKLEFYNTMEKPLTKVFALALSLLPI